MDSAGGGLGPEVPANRPPALSLIFFTGCAETGSPAMNSNGSAMVRLPPSSRAERLETTSMPRNMTSK